MQISYSVVLPTLGRIDEVLLLLNSLRNQTLPPEQIYVVDQNKSNLLKAEVESLQINNITYLQVDWVGLSRARNKGLELVSTEYVLFADDDSEFPEDTFEKSIEFLKKKPIDCLAMHLQDKTTGETMLNYPGGPTKVDFKNIHNTTCEGATLWKTSSLKSLKGYDESMGLGRFHSAEEGADLVLRALNQSYHIEYVNTIAVFHPAQRNANPERFLRYARGSGRLLRKHIKQTAAWRISVIFILKNIAGILLFAWNSQKRTKHIYRLKGFYQGFSIKPSRHY